MKQTAPNSCPPGPYQEVFAIHFLVITIKSCRWIPSSLPIAYCALHEVSISVKGSTRRTMFCLVLSRPFFLTWCTPPQFISPFSFYSEIVLPSILTSPSFFSPSICFPLPSSAVFLLPSSFFPPVPSGTSHPNCQP